MDASLAESLLEQLRKNFGDTLQALGAGQIEWGQLGIYALSQLVISVLYLGLFLGVYALLMGVVRIVLGARQLESDVFAQVRTAVRYLFGLGALLALLAQYGAGVGLLAAVARAAFMALGFYAAWLLLSRLIKEGLDRYHLDASIRQLMENLFSVLIAAFAMVTVLAQFGFDVISIVAGLGIVGIAVGFAAQSTLSSFIAGITLLVERPFRIGDWVTINGQEGKVVRIALRTTWLRTRDNIFTMMPNDKVASSEIINLTTEGATRFKIPVGIAYKESARAARACIMPLLQAHPKVLQVGDTIPRVMMSSLGDSSVDLAVQVWIGPDNLDHQPAILSEILEQIKEALDAAGIEIPFPHLQLFIDDAKGLKPILEPVIAKLR